MDQQLQNKQALEHYLKYENAARVLDIEVLIPMVLNVASEERIKQALAAGDEHLNTIPLAKWDRMVECMRLTKEQKTRIGFWSLSCGVCTLKHVALYHIGGMKPPVQE